MNVLSLFTGVGGLDLGLERAGMRVVGQCEFDSACRTVLTRHWPDTPCHPDVSGLDSEWLASVGLHERRSNGSGGDDGTEHRNGDGPGGSGIQLVCGGFPCQDLSVAGKRAGLAGERSGLFYEAARVADLVLPDGGWLLIENVPGLLSSNDGADFGIVLATLADLGFYDLAWRVVDSRYFGVPQRRRRVFILARRSRGDRARQVLLEPESGGGDFAPSGGPRPGDTPGAGQSIASALDKQSGGPDDNSAQANHIVAGPLTKRYAKGINTTMDDGAMVAQETAVRRLTPTECERLQGFPDGWTIPEGESLRALEAETAEGHGPSYSVRMAQTSSNGWGIREGETGTLDGTAGPAVLGAGRRAPTENPKPDGPRYAQMGNAVTVPVAHWIGDRIMRYGTKTESP